MSSSEAAFCRDLVGRHDYDRYMLSMAAPAAARPALWALYAFNYELARTHEAVSDMHAGYIRLAWWDEVLQAINQGKALPQHDIAKALAISVAKHKLHTEPLESLLEARGMDLESTTPASLEGMACFADATNTPLVRLTQAITGEKASPESLKNLGIAYGLCGLVRAIPFMAAHKRCYLPCPILYDVGLMPEQIHLLGPSEKLSAGVAKVVELARSYLDGADVRGGVLGRQKKLAAFYMKRIAKCGYNPFDPRVYRPVPFLGFRLMF